MRRWRRWSGRSTPTHWPSPCCSSPVRRLVNASGAGAAVVTPLTLTLLSAAVPVERRGMALGIWGAVAGLAIATGPVVGGAVVQGWSWQTIFWLNVPLGLLLLPIARLRITESRGTATTLDIRGV